VDFSLEFMVYSNHPCLRLRPQSQEVIYHTFQATRLYYLYISHWQWPA